MTWKWFKWLGLGLSLYLEGIRPMLKAFEGKILNMKIDWKFDWKSEGRTKTGRFSGLLRPKNGLDMDQTAKKIKIITF